MSRLLLDTQPLGAELLSLQPLRIEPVAPGSAETSLLGFVLQQYHYLSYRNCVGQNLNLGVIARRISGDWQDKYGHPILMLETFVEQNRFVGTCYRAAGWQRVGATTGRSRNATASTLLVPVKDVYLKALDAHWQGRLAS